VVNLNFLLLSNIVAMLVVSAPIGKTILKELGVSIPRFSLQRIVNDVRLGIPLVFVFVTDFVMAGSDRFIIALYLSSKSVGYYNPGYMLGALIIMFPKVLGVVLPPLLSKAVDEKQDVVVVDLLNKSVKLYLVLVIPYMFGCMVLGYPILALVANQEVAEVGRYIASLVSGGMLFYGLSIILAHGVAFVKLQTKVIFYSNLIAGLTSVILNIILMYFFRNILIAAGVSLVSFLVSFLYLEYRTRDQIKLNYEWMFIGKLLLSSVVMAAAIEFVHMEIQSHILVLAVGIPAGLLVYFGMLSVLKTFQEGEKEFVKQGLRKILHR